MIEIENKNRYYDNIDNYFYHQKIDALSSSLLRKGLISLAHLQVAKQRPENNIVSTGTGIHALALEDGVLPKEIEIKLDGRTKEGKDQLVRADKEGFYIIKPEVLDACINTWNTIKTHKHIVALSGYDKEVSGIAVEPTHNFLMKIRPDAIHHGLRRIIDLKSVGVGMNEHKLGMLTFRNGWLIQAAYYVYVNKLIVGHEYEFKHLFIETDPPYGIRLRSIPQAAIEKITDDLLLPFFEKYSKALELNEWPCFSEDDEITKIPGYVFSDELESEGEQNDNEQI
jgi:hypothetical protein